MVYRPLGFLGTLYVILLKCNLPFPFPAVFDIGIDGTKTTVGKRADALAQTTVWNWQLPAFFSATHFNLKKSHTHLRILAIKL